MESIYKTTPIKKGNGGKNKGKKYYTKEIDQLFHNMVYGILFFIVVVFITSVISTAHTKKFNEIMSSLNTKQVKIMDEFKTHVVKAEGVIIEYAEKDGKGVEETVKKINQYEDIKRVAKVECDKKGFGEWCVDDLIAIAHNEKADFDCDNAVGDGGVSHGCFQIHRKSHPDVTVEQARDVNFAVPWTLNRMVHYGYPTKRSYAIMRHNGRAYIPETLEYLRKVNEYIKNN